MSIAKRVSVIIVIVVMAVSVMLYRHSTRTGSTDVSPAAVPGVGSGLPAFLEIGAKSCIPCQMMQEVMAELRASYPGKLDVIFLDLDIDDTPAAEYGVSFVPTQVLKSPEGVELFRHEGFYPADEIVAKFKELGYDLGEATVTLQTGFLGRLFTTMTKAIEGTMWLALTAAFIWGILSVLLSPCHLASIPLIVGFIEKQGRTSVARAFGISTLFSVGILITIAVIGFITAAFGRMAGDVGAVGNYFVAVIFFAVGLYLLGVIDIPFTGVTNPKMARRGLLAAFLLGLIFGIAIGPCTFAYMAPMLVMVFRTGASNMLFATSLLLLYGIGHCSVIVLAGGSAEYVQRYLNWSDESRGADAIKKICGILVIAGGLRLLWTA